MSAENLPHPFNLTRYCLAGKTPHIAAKTALVFYEDIERPPLTLSYEDLQTDALKMACYFKTCGLDSGDRIFIKLRTGPQFVSAFFGAIAVGLVPIPLSTLLTHREVIKFASILSPAFMCLEKEDEALALETNSAVLYSDQFEGILADLTCAVYAATDTDDPAFMVLTSGTSATPKIVVHGHRVVLGRRPMFSGWTDIKEDDRVLHAGALNWTYSLGVGLLDVFAASATALFYQGKAKPEDWPHIISHTDATIFAGVPSLYRRILKYGNSDLIAQSALRHGLCAGEPLLPRLHDDWRARTALPLYEALGMSEISTYISSSPQVPTRPGSPGKPQEGRRVCVLSYDQVSGNEELEKQEEQVDTGILAVHGTDPGLMLGTYSEGAITPPPLHDGWFLTGDMARMDDDGYVWFEGRADDIMNVSGYRVSPAEIENVLCHASCISDLAVNAQQTPSGVWLITAHIVLSQDAGEDEAIKELEALSGKLAAYKRPKKYKVVSDLPRTKNGKIRRAEL